MINVRTIVEIDVQISPPTHATESIKAKDLVVGDCMLFRGNWHHISNNWYCAQSSYAKLNLITETEFNIRGMKAVPLAVKIPLNEFVTIWSREEQAMLAVQNAHEQAGVVSRKLEQLLDINSLPVTSSGNIRISGEVYINKETLIGSARSELKAEGNKLAEMLKKL